MIGTLLEVIALDATDARHARSGGADRVELVSGMADGGLSPSPATVAAVRAAVDVPVRVMLRREAGFAAGDVDALRRTVQELRSAGAEEFVLGFLDPSGAVALPVVYEVLSVLDGAAWTFHRAIDHATDRSAAWSALAGLPGLDTVLTAGAPTGVTDGLTTIRTDAARFDAARFDAARFDAARFDAARFDAARFDAARVAGWPRLLVGGGLREEHVGPLRAAGVTAFHSGSAVRRDRSWAGPVDPGLVRHLRDRIDG